MIGNFIGFKGRMGRGGWWLGYIITLLALFMGFGLVAFTDSNNPSIVAALVTMVASILALLVSISCTVKRYHDRNKSGWWWWIGLVPLLGFWQLIECGFCSGEEGENRFGPPPGSDAEFTPASGSGKSLAPQKASQLSKLDDNYLENYAKQFAQQQAQQQAAATNTIAGTTRQAPVVFGKR